MPGCETERIVAVTVQSAPVRQCLAGDAVVAVGGGIDGSGKSAGATCHAHAAG